MTGMKVKKASFENRTAERQARVMRLLDIPKYPLWLKILAFALGLLFICMFIAWAIWAMETVVIPRLMGRSPGLITQPARIPERR